ncbi:hypothetical protein QR680_014619 [Steinernema hermaphroditum]|uniref:Uncharacterized protein n=1 Tax=Steinernema hermaphroditum TaxID=289476 RepID=A0AA39M3J0_9BILA|nr:hypothetical protein QR680_014619 [Steinernema hermaphroditum]
MTLELATGTPFNRSEFKDIQMKHQDILVSKLEAIAFYKLVINNVKDLVQPFYLTALAHAQHIQSVASNIGTRIESSNDEDGHRRVKTSKLSAITRRYTLCEIWVRIIVIYGTAHLLVTLVQKIFGDNMAVPCIKRERKLSVSVTNNVKVEPNIPPEVNDTVVPIKEVKAIKSPFWTKVIGKIYGINLPMLVDTGATISIALGSMVALLTAKPRRIESAAMGASGQMIQFKSEATVSSFGRVNSPLVALVWFGQWQNEVLQA